MLMLGLATGLFAQNVNISAPASIAGDYLSKQAGFGALANGESGQVVLADDGDVTGAGGTINDGCQAIINDVSGKIAMINRGTCGFSVKAASAQAAGAIAVIVCNNLTAFPDSTIFMGNGAGDFSVCDLDIPAVMLSYGACEIIKAELANGVMATLPDNTPEPGEAVGAEIALPGEGTYTATELTGTGSLFTDAESAKVYSIVAPADAVMNVNSCNGGVDTRLFVLGGCRGNGTLLLLGAADDECESVPGEALASNLDVLVTAGETYLIYWDDAWSNAGFDFTVSFGAIPDVDVTFNVDMQDEAVAADGVKISINGGAELDMTDNGDGTWSYTGSFPAGSALDYSFHNGAGNAEDNPDVAACRSVVVGLEPVSTSLVCYNSCLACPPDAVCPVWVDENLDNYTLGGISAQSDLWAPWSGGSVPAEDALVSDAQVFSAPHSLLIANANGDDQLLLLGDRTSGNFILRWKMFIPTGSSGYYNLQKFQATPGVAGGFAMEANFAAAGTGSINAGVANAATFTYPQGQWFDVAHHIDIDNNKITLLIDGELAYSWPFNYQANALTGTAQLGAINFYGNTGNLYYVDDIQLKEIDPCPADAIICDGFDGYYPGTLGTQSPWWTTWTLMDGAADDGLVSSEQFFSCEQALKIEDAAVAGDDVILLLGNQTAGNYWLSWNMYVPEGSSAYYNIQKDSDKLPAPVTADFALQIDMAADGTAAVDAGGFGAFSFNYPHDVWFNIFHEIDLDNDIARLWVDGIPVLTWQPSWNIQTQTGYLGLGAVDFFGNAGNLYYVDDVIFVQAPSVPGNICGGAIDLNDYIGNGVGSSTTTPIYDNTNYYTTELDPTTGWECFGEPDGAGAAPELNNTIWYTFVGDGETYNITTNACDATDVIDAGDTQMAIYAGDNCADLTPVACNEDIIPQPVPDQFWAGTELATTAGTTYYMLIDGFNFDNGLQLSDGEFCITFEQLTGVIPTYEVTLEVDLADYVNAGGTVSANGVHVAGSFQGWDPAATPLTNIPNTYKYTVTLELEEGEYEYKFINGNAWGTCDVDQECLEAGLACGTGANDNRLLVVGADITEAHCYDKCGACLFNSVDDATFGQSIKVQPNPASNSTFIVYDMPSTADLSFRILNNIGQVVFAKEIGNTQSGKVNVDLSQFVSGVYFIHFSNGENNAVRKLVVEK